MKVSFALATASLLLATTTSMASAVPDWEHPDQIDAPEGHAQVIWSTPTPIGEDTFELQISLADRPFRSVYRGSDRASVLSGLPRGETVVRVRTLTPEKSDWSTEAIVSTSYPSRSATLGWMTLGLALFLATAGYVITATRRRR